MNEAFTSSVGTQRSDLGKFKLFCMDITTLTMANLIISDLFIVKPMSSFSGYLTYMQYALGTTKGGVTAGTVIQDPFVWGQMTEDRSNYTSEKVVEAAAAGTGAQALAWTTDGDIAHGVFPVTVSGVTTNYDIKLVKAGATDVYGFYNKTDKKFYSDAAYTTQITVAADTKVAYVYDNITIPQENLPTLVGKMQGITLQAKARRIAVYYKDLKAVA